jgi:DNA-binding transcriptional LysR family regulator
MIDPLTLDQMRVLIAVVETGSFSGAARRLGRVQSAISQSINTLESVLGLTLFDRAGKTPVLTEPGKAILKDARRLVDGARSLKARAESIVADIEPELTLAVDAFFPTGPLMASLKALRGEFPQMPVSVFTEGLGGPEQRLRDGVARLAIYPFAVNRAPDLAAEFLTEIALIPVVAAHHPLAEFEGSVTREALEPHIQLVLTDRTPLTQNLQGGVISHNIWRFADLSTRLDFLLAGFGWCNMPAHMVIDHIEAGRLKRLTLAETEASLVRMHIHVVRERGREIGRVGRWLIEDLRLQLAGPACTAHRREIEGKLAVGSEGDQRPPALVA